MIITVAVQPLHSHTVINIHKSTFHDDIGTQYLHSELCGSKYSDGISHLKKLSNLLDSINTQFLSTVTTDCVCCESSDTAKYDFNFIYELSNQFTSIDSVSLIQLHEFFVKKFPACQYSTRAPPLA